MYCMASEMTARTMTSLTARSLEFCYGPAYKQTTATPVLLRGHLVTSMGDGDCTIEAKGHCR